MENFNDNKGSDDLNEKDRTNINNLVEELDTPVEGEPKYKRWEEDAARSALFEEDEKRPVLSVLGLVLGLLCWISLFALHLKNIELQLYVSMAVTLAAFLMSFFGRKRAFGMSVIGMFVSGGFMLFMIIALIVVLVTK